MKMPATTYRSENERTLVALAGIAFVFCCAQAGPPPRPTGLGALLYESVPVSPRRDSRCRRGRTNTCHRGGVLSGVGVSPCPGTCSVFLGDSHVL